MKKILFIIVILGILLSMSNCKDPEEEGPFSLIGTWEAEGETDDNKWSFTCTLIFYDETNYKQNDIWTSKQNENVSTFESKGTYIREEENIIYTEDGPMENKYTNPYKLINRNKLETFGIGFTSDHLAKMTFTRKN